MKHLIAFAAVLTIVAAPAAAKAFKVGEPAPPVELTLVDGTKTTLAEHKGEVILLNFWATWCVPCRAELPLLDAYYRRQKQHGLQVFAITTEGSVPLQRMKALFAAMAIPSVRRVKGMPVEMPAVPTNYIIDRTGVVRYASAGAFSLDDLNREIVPLLRER